MTHWLIICVAAVLAVSGYIFILTALSRQLKLQADINSKLHASDKFEPLFWSLGTWKKFRDLERLHFPGGGKLRKVRKLQVLGIALVLSGLLLGIRAIGGH
jgi:hypothetical protein